jgi:TonB family protein
MTVNKFDKYVFTFSFILSLSLFLLLEACPLQLLAEDIYQREEQEIEIEVLLSEPQGIMTADSGDISGNSKADSEESTQDSSIQEQPVNEDNENINTEELAPENEINEVSEVIEKAEAIKEIEKENNESSNFISEEKVKQEELVQEKPEEKKPEERETDTKEELIKKEQEPEAEVATEKKPVIDEPPEKEEPKEIIEETIIEEEEIIEETNDMPAWMTQQEEAVQEEKEESKNSKTERFDLEKYLAELETDSNESVEEDSNQIDSNSQTVQNSDENNSENAGQSSTESESAADSSSQSSNLNSEGSSEQKVYDLRQSGNNEITKPTISDYKQPEYPSQMIRREIEAGVLLSLKIDKEGKTSELEVYESSGYNLFDQAALDAVKNWEFNPAKLDDENVNVKILIPIKFKLD